MLMPSLALQSCCLLCLPVSIWSQTYVSFDGASASSTYSTGAFSADQALSVGSGYWCSSGSHNSGQSVTWTGVLDARREVLGAKLNWAYGPGEFKLLFSSDGGNFEEAACSRSTSRSEVSYEETVMFDSVRTVKSLTIVMKVPMPWGYFGLNDVSLLTTGDEPVMVISGATSKSGERCLTASGTELSAETCLDAIASGDGRDVFRFQGEQLAHVASNMCLSLVNGDTSHVGLQDCKVAAGAQDGRSAWELTPDAQLKMPHAGNYCLILEEDRPTVKDCSEAAQRGDSADKYILAAVPELDLSAVASAKAGASLLSAAAGRQRQALGNLQALLPALDTCKISVLAASANHSLKSTALYQVASGSAAAAVFSREDTAMTAIGRIYSSIGVDMDSSLQLIAESSSALEAAEAKIARAA